MKFIGTLFWMTLLIGSAGFVLGALYGIVVGAFTLGIDAILTDGAWILALMFGGAVGGMAGGALGIWVGLFMAVARAQYDAPLTPADARRIRNTGIVGALLGGIATLALYYLNARNISLIEDAVVLWVPAVIALGVSSFIISAYSRRLARAPKSDDDDEPRRLGPLAALIALLGWAYALLVVPPLLANLVLGEFWWPIALYNTVAHVAWLPAFGLIIVALLWRRWLVAGLALIPIAAFVFAYGPRYLRPIEPTLPPEDNPEWYLDVVSYNVLWRNGDNDDVIRAIAAMDADVIALQEVGFDAAARIEQAFADEYPHMALHPQRFGIDGQAILSRYPIVSSEFWEAESVLGAQEAVITFSDGARSADITIHNVHPYHPGISRDRFFDPAVREVGITNVLQRVADDTSQYRILLGDFNMPDLSTDYARVAADWTDTYAARGFGLGLTHRPFVRTPRLLRLDYIFVDGWINTRQAAILPDNGGSDHHPVFARLYINLDPTAS